MIGATVRRNVQLLNVRAIGNAATRRQSAESPTLVDKLRDGVNWELKHGCINSEGAKQRFNAFLGNSLAALLDQAPPHGDASLSLRRLRALCERYANMDIAERKEVLENVMDAIKLLEMAPVIRRTASFPSSAAPTPSPPRGPLAPNSRYAPPGVVDLTRASPSSVSGVPINVAPQPRFPQSSPASIPPQPLRRQPPLLVSPQPAPRLPAPQPGSASVSWRIEHATWSEQASVTFLPPGSNTCWVPIVFDLETTGLDKSKDVPIEIAATAPLTGRSFSTFVRLPDGKRMHPSAETTTGLLTTQFQDPTLPAFPQAYLSFLNFIESEVAGAGPGALPLLVGHNIAGYDLPLLCNCAKRFDLPIPRDARILDTLTTAKAILTGPTKPEKFTLSMLYTYFTKRKVETAHRAAIDVDMTIEVLRALVQRSMGVSDRHALERFFGRRGLPSAFDDRGWVGHLSLESAGSRKNNRSSTRSSTSTSGAEFGGKKGALSLKTRLNTFGGRALVAPPLGIPSPGTPGDASIGRSGAAAAPPPLTGVEIEYSPQGAEAPELSDGLTITFPEYQAPSSSADEFSVEAWAVDDPLSAIESGAVGSLASQGAAQELTYAALMEAHASWQALAMDPSISDTFLTQPVAKLKRTGSFTPADIKNLTAAGITRLVDVLELYPRNYTSYTAGRLPDLSLDEGEVQVVSLPVKLDDISVSINSYTGSVILNAFLRVVEPNEAGLTSAVGTPLADSYKGRETRLIYSVFRKGRYAKNAIAYEEKELRSKASMFAVSGKVSQASPQRFGPDAWELSSSGLDFMSIDSWRELSKTGESHIRSSYPTKNGIVPEKVASLVNKALGALRAASGRWEDPIPAAIRQNYQLPGYLEALEGMHSPKSPEEYELARQRLAFQELLVVQLKLLLQRANLRLPTSEADQQGVRATDLSLVNLVRQALPYELTGAQDRALEAILEGMAGWPPMMTLLQGDVGCGKTVVAFLAVLAAAGSGYQAAVMAPTEILAEQHFAVMKRLIEEARITSEDGMEDSTTATALANLPEVALLTGSTRKAERARIYAGLQDGSIGVVVGTHALISDPVTFSQLGLAVIDEQHKFGVGQRAALLAKASPSPHILSMSATPIPRSLALVAHGELNLVIIDELPPGRIPVDTRVIMDEAASRAEVYDHMRREVAAGGQVYIVCPLVEEKEKNSGARSSSGSSDEDTSSSNSRLSGDVGGNRQLKAAVQERDRLVAEGEIAAELCGVLHGRMSSEEKEAALAAFVSGRTPVLISTTVVEVGVDVPAASLMIVEHADRFGLAQLHQLRGRVGRGDRASACYLLTDKSGEESERLKVLEKSSSGFDVAEADFAIRGAGDVIGRRQSGKEALGSLKVTNLPEDAALVEAAREAAAALMAATHGKPTGWSRELLAAVVDPSLVDLDLAEIPSLG